MQKQRTTWKLKAESRESGNENAHVLVFAACMCSLIGARGWTSCGLVLSDKGDFAGRYPGPRSLLYRFLSPFSAWHARRVQQLRHTAFFFQVALHFLAHTCTP
jgi:hypothetical protein